MSVRPTGTVTFLFTDIEGSTKLAQRYPDTMPALLARHHAILHQAIESHNGHVFQIIGDAFCAAFHNATDAVHAALTAQRLLHQEPWSPAPIKVRMGINTGAAHAGAIDAIAGGYTGYSTLARTQRVMSTAYGEQILISNSSAELLRGELPKGIALRDMGEHRLKSILNPERLWQVVASDLPQDFSPLQTLNAIPNNVPIQLTSFIGREKEVEQVKESLKTTRLLTLTGMGGTGKTRLSLHVATELLDTFANGAWIVELASLTDPALVVQTIAAVFGLKEETGRPLAPALNDYVRTKELLMILDNCEHMIDACARVADSLLHNSSKLKILATSRQPLGITGETTLMIPPLALPDLKNESSVEQLVQAEAVRLFLDRASAAQPNFRLTSANAKAVAQVCQHLDGIPLAIELAAARVRTLSVEQIVKRLEDRFRLLTGGSRTTLPRQQTLGALIDWSYDLLSESERIEFRRLSAFVGGWTLGAAEMVCAGAGIESSEVLELLTHLVDKSLVIADNSGAEMRYRLPETIREYARLRLHESGELEQVWTRHGEYYANLGEQAEPNLRSADQKLWFIYLEKEHDNLRAVFQRCQAAKVNAQLGLRLAGAIWWFWYMFGSITEGHLWLESMLELPGAATQTKARSKALCGAAILGGVLGHFDIAHSRAEDGLAIGKELGDQEEIANGLFARCAVTYFEKRNVASIRPSLEECLSINRSIGYQWGVGEALHLLGHVAAFLGDHSQARLHFEASMATFRKSGDSSSFAHPLRDLGREYGRLGDYNSARAVLEEALIATRELGNTWTAATCLRDLGNIALSQCDLAIAFSYLNESLILARGLGDPIRISQCSNQLGNVLVHQGKYSEASACLEEGLALSKEYGLKLENAQSLQVLGHFAKHQGEHHRAGTLCRESLKLSHEVNSKEGVAESLEGLAQVAIANAEYQKAARLFGAAEALRKPIGVPVPPYLLSEYANDIGVARAQLDETAFNAAWAKGRAMTMEHVIAYALEDPRQG